MDKVNILGKFRHYLRELDIQLVLCHLDSFINAAYRLLQEVQVSILRTDYAFPVPLVNINGVDIVQILIGAKGVHISIDASARQHFKFGKLQSLPFGKRMNHLSLAFPHTFDRETDRALHPVEVIIDTCSGQHDHRGCHPEKGELGGQIVLKHSFDGLDGLFCILGVAEQVPVRSR